MSLHESELEMVEMDKAMVEKEVKHVQIASELRLKIAELEKQLELGALQRRLMDSNTELAKEKGFLNCRGMIRLIEEKMRKVCIGKGVKPNYGRYALWEQCLDMEEFKPLRDCLYCVTGSQARTPKPLGQSVASFYSELNLPVHRHNRSVFEYKLNISAAKLSKPQARMLACMAEFLMIRYTTDVKSSDDGEDDKVESDEYTGEN
jgi:hypothetical protein